MADKSILCREHRRRGLGGAKGMLFPFPKEVVLQYKEAAASQRIVSERRQVRCACK